MIIQALQICSGRNVEILLEYVQKLQDMHTQQGELKILLALGSLLNRRVGARKQKPGILTNSDFRIEQFKNREI